MGIFVFGKNDVKNSAKKMFLPHEELTCNLLSDDRG